MSATCRGCGKPIVWGETADGKKIPLDPRAPVYQLFEIDFGKKIEAVRAEPTKFMVAHFATCSKANDFSGSKKR